MKFNSNEENQEGQYVISVSRNEALFLDDSVTLMIETTPDNQNVRPLRPISPIINGGVPAPMELIQKIGKAVLYTCSIENRNKEYKLFLDEFELLILREICVSTAKLGADLVGFSLKKKILHALLKSELELEQQINQVLYNMSDAMEKHKESKTKNGLSSLTEESKKTIDEFLKSLENNEEK